jgi:quinohemoprotein ethanol dehydrogenase
VFSLGGSATLPRYERPVPSLSAPDFALTASRADVDAGATLYATFCSRCHGVDAIAGGSVPDLRLAQDSTHGEWVWSVLGGGRRQFGMPSFADDLNARQARLIHAYVLERARASARNEEAAILPAVR